MNIKGKQIADNTITQELLNITTDSIVSANNITNKEYVDTSVNSAFTNITNNLSNLNMDALATTPNSGFMLACNTGLLAVPMSLVAVTVNGVEVNVGVGLDCAFSGDNGVTFREVGTEELGDLLYWNTESGKYQLETTDVIDFCYLTKK